MSKPITIGQSHNIISILANNTDWSVLDGGLLQENIIDNPKEAGVQFTEFLRRGGCITERNKFLQKRDNIQFLEHKNFNLKKFYKTRNGLYILECFIDRILSVAENIDTVPAVTGANFDLINPANDAEICSELPENHIFEDASVFCAYLAGLIEKQKGGESGNLLNNGYANIFYVRGALGEVFAVCVRWYSGSRRWHVNAFSLASFRWSAGSRAFSSNC